MMHGPYILPIMKRVSLNFLITNRILDSFGAFSRPKSPQILRCVSTYLSSIFALRFHYNRNIHSIVIKWTMLPYLEKQIRAFHEFVQVLVQNLIWHSYFDTNYNWNGVGCKYPKGSHRCRNFFLRNVTSSSCSSNVTQRSTRKKHEVISYFEVQNADDIRY